MPYKIIACSRNRYCEYFNQLNQWLEAFHKFIRFSFVTGFIDWQVIDGKADDLQLFFGGESLSDCIYFQQLQGTAMGFMDPISDIIYKIDTFGARFDNDDDSIYPLPEDCAFPAFNGCDKAATNALFLKNLQEFKTQLVSVFDLKNTLFHTPEAVLTKDYSTMLSQYAWLGLDVIFVILGAINDETVSHFCNDYLEPLKKEPKESLIALGLDELRAIESLELPVYTQKEIALRRTLLLQQQTIIERTEAIERTRENLRSLEVTQKSLVDDQPLKDAKVLAAFLLKIVPEILSSSPSLEVCEMYQTQIVNQLAIISDTDKNDPLILQLRALDDDIRATMRPLDALTIIDELAVPTRIGLPDAGNGAATGGLQAALLGQIRSRGTEGGAGNRTAQPTPMTGTQVGGAKDGSGPPPPPPMPGGAGGKGGFGPPPPPPMPGGSRAALLGQIRSRGTEGGAPALDSVTEQKSAPEPKTTGLATSAPLTTSDGTPIPDIVKELPPNKMVATMMVKNNASYTDEDKAAILSAYEKNQSEKKTGGSFLDDIGKKIE